MTKGCENCEYMLPIGEGIHLCDECEDESGCPALVLDDYGPTDEYLICGCKKWKER